MQLAHSLAFYLIYFWKDSFVLPCAFFNTHHVPWPAVHGPWRLSVWAGPVLPPTGWNFASLLHKPRTSEDASIRPEHDSLYSETFTLPLCTIYLHFNGARSLLERRSGNNHTLKLALSTKSVSCSEILGKNIFATAAVLRLFSPQLCNTQALLKVRAWFRPGLQQQRHHVGRVVKETLVRRHQHHPFRWLNICNWCKQLLRTCALSLETRASPQASSVDLPVVEWDVHLHTGDALSKRLWPPDGCRWPPGEDNQQHRFCCSAPSRSFTSFCFETGV